MRVLIAEDDEVLQRGLMRVLVGCGHEVQAAGDGRQADLMLATGRFDLLVLDLGLPLMDGLAVLMRLRRRHVHLPVLILSARGRPEDRVRGLDEGADDYLCKPFDLAEFEARVRALARRGSSQHKSLGQLAWHGDDQRFWCGNAPLALAPLEHAVLSALFERPGRIAAKARLVEQLQALGGSGGDNMVEVHVHRLRRKLQAAGVEIRTVRGLGYVLVEPRADG